MKENLFIKIFKEDCIDCGICSKSCFFLEKFGSPLTILNLENISDIPFHCTGCGLCTSVCTSGLDPSALFYELKKDCITNRYDPVVSHGSFLNFEEFGRSVFATINFIPENSESVFFPGCSFTGTRPEKVISIFKEIQKRDKNLGLVLNCCSTPSYSLGLSVKAEEQIRIIIEKFKELGIKRIYLACPNCFVMFKRYAPEFEIKMVFSLFLEYGILFKKRLKNREYTIHDPCVLRNENNLHSDIRNLISLSGIKVKESDHVKSQTICCGSGAGLTKFDPELSLKWKKKIIEKSGSLINITYCSGCQSQIGDSSIHILDLFFDDVKKKKEFPFTYLARIILKLKIFMWKILGIF